MTRINRQRSQYWNAIEQGAVRAERGAVAFVALLVVLLAILMITYMVTKPEMM